ncbi:MAG: sensor histidine kinase [Bacillota bacterium]
MKHSIKHKLFAMVTMILMSFFLAIYVINLYLLDDIFIRNNRKAMQQIYDEFVEKLERGVKAEDILYEVENEYSGNIMIIDNRARVMASTYSGFSKGRIERTLFMIADNIRDFRTASKDDTMFMVLPDKPPAMTFMAFIGKLPHGGIFVAEKSMRVVYDNSRAAGKFIVLSGLLTLAIASVTVYFISVKFTKPIIHMNEVAQHIAEQNFTDRVEVSSEDEIGMLGSSINNISDKLSDALGQLIEANKKLQQDIEYERSMEKMRRHFVSSVSHELKTPISMIQGYADGLKHSIVKKPEDISHYAEVIIDESEKMSHLIKDLLDLSSYEAGTFKINKSSFDISGLVRSCMNKYIKKLDEGNVRLKLVVPEGLKVTADSLRVEQVISNFMSNALKHVNDNGEIRVEVNEKEEYIRLSIFNTGKQIDEAEMDNIWTSFYKVDTKDYLASAGTGLGLAVVRAIVELHEGRYGVYNVAEGVTFWIELPRYHHISVT